MTEIRGIISEANNFRTAVRVYSERSVSREDMELLLDIAHQSPSSVGLEGWRFLIFDNKILNPELKAALKAVSWGAQPQFDTASHFIFLLAEKGARYDSESMYQSLLRRGITDQAGLEGRLALYEQFQKSDLKIADDERALFDWTAKQTYIVLGNLMTTAALMGIDSCPIEGFDVEQVNTILAQANLINPSKESIVTMLSLGYRLKDPKHPKTRKPREAVITWLTDEASSN